MAFVLGLTGGIGSGKTAASDFFASLGITIVDADVVARVVVEPGTPALASIRNTFGPDVLLPDGTLNRRALRDIVFADTDARKALEAITHPAIAQEIQQQLAASTSPYSILVSPLLLETSQKQLVNRVLLIDAPVEAQLTRTRERDQVSEEQVKAIIAAQMPREQKQQLADDSVLNDGDLGNLHRQLSQLHTRYLEMARTP